MTPRFALAPQALDVGAAAQTMLLRQHQPAWRCAPYLPPPKRFTER
jgi:hypothetical protein